LLLLRLWWLLLLQLLRLCLLLLRLWLLLLRKQTIKQQILDKII
jgi:hypothetical protein